VSYLFKGDSRATLYSPHLAGRLPVIAFMTLAELELWAEVNHWGARSRQRLARFLTRYVTHYPDGRLCRLWAAVTAEARQAGRPISAPDAWIAATALRYTAPLVTHNPGDYAGVRGLLVVSAVSP
jgi:predicted nucleic acid-binding protein